MNWRNWQALALSIGMTAAAGQVAYALDSQPSSSALQEMGLGGLVVMSDNEALAVRGQGFSSGSMAQASGNSFATINTPFGDAHSENAYASKGPHKAGGDNFSFAGFSITTSGDKSGHGDRGNKSDKFGGNPCKVRNSCNSHPPDMGGGKGGMGGKTSTTTFVVFAGGFSHAFAH